MTVPLILLLVASTACASCAAKAGPGEESKSDSALTNAAGALFQRSYDAEAVGSFDVAIDALAALPPAERYGYLAELRRGWLLYRLGRYAEAITSYNAASAREPASIESRLGVLNPLVALEKWKELEVAAQEIIDRDPENYVAQARLALALASVGRYPEAETVYRKVLLRYPGDVDIKARLAWTIFKMGRRADAAKVFGEILRIAPQNPSAIEGWRAASAP